MPGTQIKPYVEEISLAFDPANRKKFILMKEGIMPNLVEVLTSKEPMPKEKEIDAVLGGLVKDLKLTQDGSDAIKGVLRVLDAYKSGIPKDIISTLAKSIPDYAEFAIPADEDADAREARFTKELDEAKKTFVEKEKGELEKQIRKDLEKELKKDGDPKALQARVEDLEKELKKSNENTDKIKNDARRTELRVMVKEIGVIGDADAIEKHVDTIVSLEKSDKKLADGYIEQLKETRAKLDAAGVFSDLGNEGPGDGDSPYDKLKKIVDDLTKDGKMMPSEAWRKAAKDNPQLYKEYREGARR